MKVSMWNEPESAWSFRDMSVGAPISQVMAWATSSLRRL